METFRTSYQISVVENDPVSRSLPFIREALVRVDCVTYSGGTPMTRDSKNDCESLIWNDDLISTARQKSDG